MAGIINPLNFESFYAGINTCMAGINTCMAGINTCMAGINTCMAGINTCIWLTSGRYRLLCENTMSMLM